MATEIIHKPVSLDLELPIWERFFTVAPLVLVGSREPDGSYNQAPKHMAFPLGWDNFFGFVCTPAHSTYHNIKREEVFTVTYPRPTQVILASLAAAPRDENRFKPSILALPTFEATKVDGKFVEDGYLFLECKLERIVDGFGGNSLIAGKVVAAHVHPAALRLTDREDSEILSEEPLLVYLYPGRFARVTRTFTFPFPSDFQR